MFRIEIETDNDAFADGKAGAELARILRKLADELETTEQIETGLTCDVNGNTVGWYLY